MRRTNPLAEEIRRRKEMEAKRAATAQAQQARGRIVKPRPAKKGSAILVVAGAVAVILMVVVILWAMGVFG